MWILFHDKLNTNEIQWRKGMLASATCSCCMQGVETSLHLFQNCYFALEVWNLWHQFGINNLSFFNLDLNECLKRNCSISTCFVDDTPWNIQFVLTPWKIWKYISAFIFKQASTCCSQIWIKSRQLENEIGSILLRRQKYLKVAKYVKWKPPTTKYFILTTYGVVKVECKSAFVGGLVRNCKREWVSGFVINIGRTYSFFAELWGVREGLLLAKDLNLTKLIVEMDVATTVELLKKEVDLSHPCATLVQDCISLLQEGWVKEVRHISR
ncbi:hypothetical protein REPUB_Repub16aG0028500 [Reevesia pubescens]